VNSQVFTRDGTAAKLTGCASVAGFPLCGRRNDGVLELWDKYGRWRQDGADHPLDIVSIVTPTGATVPFLGLAPS